MAEKHQTKYIFVTGGVLSGLGKGITAASLGTILKARGFSITLQKCDPYLNTDAGTLNPAEHGEVFVTADGAETDLDLGHYERFIDRELTQSSSTMSGRIFQRVIQDERAGNYLGKTVQIIPHVTAAMQHAIMESGKGSDIHIVEIGGTVGDYESLGWLEAIRQMRRRVGSDNAMYVNLVYVPYLSASKEFKTKPAQNAMRDLRELGIIADMIVVRSDDPIGRHVIDKIAMFGDIDTEGVIPIENAKSVYQVPLFMEDRGVGEYITKVLRLPKRKPDLKSWKALANTILQKDRTQIKIGVVAKYMHHEDTYTSVFEAIKAAAWANKLWAEIVWIDAEKIEDDENLTELEGVDGIIVPGGFGPRGMEGKVKSAGWAMDHKAPYLGLCLGLQAATIALARKALGTVEANSTEMDEGVKHPVISLMADQEQVTDKGGTMRLGDYDCVLTPGTISAKAYGAKSVKERHRHRYEFNNTYRDVLQNAGLVLAGLSPDKRLVEIIEIKDHPFFVASQFHPEFKSRPQRPHPLFDAFMKAIVKQKGSKLKPHRAATKAN